MQWYLTLIVVYVGVFFSGEFFALMLHHQNRTESNYIMKHALHSFVWHDEFLHVRLNGVAKYMGFQLITAETKDHSKSY